MNFELGKCCFEEFIFIRNILMLVFPWLLPNDLNLKMLIFNYIFMEDDNLTHVFALLASVFFPESRVNVMFICCYTSAIFLKSYFDIFL